MSFTGYLRGIWNAMLNRTTQGQEYISPWEHHATYNEISARYNGFDARYENSDYEELTKALKDANQLPDGFQAIKSLRNPINRVAEVYAANTLEHDLVEHVIPDKDNPVNVELLKPLITKVWKGAEWKEEARRAYPVHGELWLKVASSEDKERVYPQIINPRHVIEFDKDERGFLTYLRIDIPRDRRTEDNEIEEYLYVEVWDKESSTLQIWEDEDASPGTDVDDLKGLIRTVSLTEEQGTSERFTGYDFIPVVHIPFRKVLGKKRGMPPYEHVITNVDRLNELVTRMHSMMFPDTVWVLGRTGPEGEPLAPIQLEGLDAEAALTEAEQQNIKVITVNNERIIRLPANASFEPKIPSLDFAGHGQAINDEVAEIERELPELAYYRIRELELSGYAIELTLKDLIDRVREARSNLERGLVRFNQMALTIGRVIGLEDFSGVGDFKAGALDHMFEDRDVFTPVQKDQVETNVQKAALWRSWADLGILEEMLIEEEGMDPARAKRIAAKVRPTTIPGLELFGTSQPNGNNPQEGQNPDEENTDDNQNRREGDNAGANRQIQPRTV
jgi:hypothetical protein